MRPKSRSIRLWTSREDILCTSLLPSVTLAKLFDDFGGGTLQALTSSKS
jgi:hypothetical protein